MRIVGGGGMIPKFRAWDKVDKKIRKVMSLDFYNTRQSEVTLASDGDVYLRYFEQIELMQYTGLKDKNGKEIYEGDILGRQFYINAIVSYDDGAFEQGWNCHRKHRLDQDFCSSREVIGNIYENKDLIEVE